MQTNENRYHFSGVQGYIYEFDRAQTFITGSLHCE